MNKLKKLIILKEYKKITNQNVADNPRIWALFATSFYERLFEKINDLKKLERVYNKLKTKLKRKDELEAIEFFYNLRKQELEGTFKWEVKLEEIIRDIIKEEIKKILN